MRSTRSRRQAPAAVGPQGPADGWGSLIPDVLQQCFAAVIACEHGHNMDGIRAWAAVLSVNKHWRGLALQMPIDAVCSPSSQLIAWLRRVRVRRLEFQHGGGGAALACQGFASSEQRYRASISTLLATLDFIKNSAATLKVLSGVHPREGILYLTPFQALERVSMCGTASEMCKLDILEGLPHLTEVVATGYGEYSTEGLPATVQHLDLQWAGSAASFSTIYFHLPEACALTTLTLASQRPLCIAAPFLSRCTDVRISARRAYLGLPLRRGAPWVDVDQLAARFAQFMLSGALEAVEVTATRFFVFQPVQDAYDLSTNDGLGGIAQHEQLATVLLARHFQSLHVEQRMLAVGALRSYARITRRRAEPMAFSFSAPLNTEQLEFLQQHALATSISFGPVSLSDALSVLNCPAFAERNGPLLQQLQHLEISSQLNLAPYQALQNVQGTWQSEPQVALGGAQLTSLRLTPPLGTQQQSRCFQSQWLSGVRQLTNLALVRFASVDLSRLTVCPSNIHIAGLQPTDGMITPANLQLPAAGFGPRCALALRMAYAPPHGIHAGAGQEAQQNNGAHHAAMMPGVLAAALQHQAAAAVMQQQAAAAAAAAAAMAQHAAAAAMALPLQQAAAQQPQPAAPQEQHAQQQQAGQPQQEVQQQVAQQQQPAQQQQQQQQQQDGLMLDLGMGSDDEDDGEGADVDGIALPHQQAVAAPAAAAPAAAVAAAGAAPAAQPMQQEQAAPQLEMLLVGAPPFQGLPQAVEAAVAAAAAGNQDPIQLLIDSDDDDDDMPGLINDDTDDEGAFVQPQAGGGGAAGGPWVMVPPVPPQQGPGLNFAQPWVMPDDRLCDVTIRHDSLFSSVGSLSVHAGALTLVYTGTGPHHLLQLLAGGSSHHGSGEAGQSGGGGSGNSMLRTLRLTARSLRFEAVPAKSEEGQGQQQEQQGPQAEGAALAREAVTSCSGAELRDYINSSEWAAVWDTKLQRSMFRGQETLVLTRREVQAPSRFPAASSAAAAPATL